MAGLASQQAVSSVTVELLKAAATMDDAALTTVGSDLAGVAAVLAGRPQLRRLLTEETAPPEARVSLARRLFDGRVDVQSGGLIALIAGERWSSGRDLVDGVRWLSRTALFLKAERARELDDVEEEIFRFGRILDANPELSMVLDNPATSADARVAIIERLLSGKARPLTLDLLTGLAGDLGGRTFAHGVTELVEQAAQRRDKLVAIATAASPLTNAELERLRAALSGIYARQVLVHVVVDPKISGGLRVRVGDEVIDGSISGQMA
ncbi:MAG: F0F1 ATP synthase subunit delta, partial [Nakamurella sp.]